MGISNQVPFLWEDGTILALNSLVLPSAGLYLEPYVRINGAGQILCSAVWNGVFYGCILRHHVIPAAQSTDWLKGYVSRILAGIINDSGGVVWGPQGPRSEPPWSAIWERFLP